MGTKPSCHLIAFAVCFVFFSCLPAVAGDASLAPTPPMGWNSWDSYGRTITEAQLKGNADWMAAHLKRVGWQYVVIDEGWYVLNPASDPKDYKFLLSGDGRFIPVPERFPSATNDAGFKPLADYVHSLGLKFGIHMIRGIPREAVAKNLPVADSSYHAQNAADQSDACPWNAYNWGVKNSEAGQAYYDSVLKLYASWNVDFIKVDCIADHPYKPEEIRMIGSAIKKAGRPMVLSLSPGPTALDHADAVSKHAEMWRICDDFWDHWGPWEKHDWSQSLYQQFATTAKWEPHVAPGSWPDADMLPLGHLGPHPGDGELRETRFTKDEQRTMVTLWSIFRSPLIMGGDLLSMDDWTTSLLTNPEVIAVDQNSGENHAVVTTDKTAIWLARGGSQGVGNERGGKDYYLAVFNIGDAEQTIHYEWKDLGLTEKSYKLRDLWEHKELGKAGWLTVKLRPHASVLYRLDGK
jgi:alpha-galactosidase